MPKPLTEFSAKVLTTDYEEFTRHFPNYGASTWFIRTCLSEFLRTVKDDPDARARVRESIDRMVAENRTAAA